MGPHGRPTGVARAGRTTPGADNCPEAVAAAAGLAMGSSAEMEEMAAKRQAAKSALVIAEDEAEFTRRSRAPISHRIAEIQSIDDGQKAKGGSIQIQRTAGLFLPPRDHGIRSPGGYRIVVHKAVDVPCGHPLTDELLG